MSNIRVVAAAALSLLALASCGSRESAAAENNFADAGTDVLENAGPADPGEVNGVVEPGGDTVPPPDAVSHPDGYLPNAGDPPASSAPEPATAGAPGSREPATEDEYIRNKQAGR
jgi:hypothetical protein